MLIEVTMGVLLSLSKKNCAENKICLISRILSFLNKILNFFQVKKVMNNYAATTLIQSIAIQINLYFPSLR